MPVNKAARFRFEIIDDCLRNTKRRWSKADLLYYVNRGLQLHYDNVASISLSQIRYDIENMQTECRAPIEMYRQGKMHYYRYTDPAFSIRNIPVNEEDIVKLNHAVQLLQQLKGFVIADEVAEIVRKLEAKYDFNVETQRNIIELDNSASGNENLEDIYHCIVQRNVLKVKYHPFHYKTAQEHHVHPYLLKKHCSIWYLAGYCQETGKIGVYEIDRIKEMRVTSQPYVQELFKMDDYFDHLIGISRPSEKIEEIRLLFSSSKAPYILSYPMHSSQEIVREEEDGKVEISLKVIINTEFTNLLLSYGGEVRVLSPRHLALRICGTAKKLLKYYT